MNENQGKPNPKHRAIACFQSNRFREAHAACTEACRQSASDPECWHLLGAINNRLGDYQAGAACYRRAIALRPGFFEAHSYLGLTLLFLGRQQAALQHFRRAIAIRPDFVEGHIHLGCLFRELRRYEEAIACFRQALQIDPDDAEARTQLGNILRLGGRNREALDCYRQVIRQHPEHAEAIAGEAMLLEKQGKQEAAFRRIRPLVDQGRAGPVGAFVFATLAPRYDCREEAIALLESFLESREIMPSAKRDLHYGLGDLFDSMGKYDRAFTHYRAANAAYTQAVDLDTLSREITALTGFFGSDTLGKLPVVKPAAPQPVFIVGMPRSGTTLVEQILDSHPAVTGGGELPWFPELVAELKQASTDHGVSYPEILAEVTQAEYERLAAAYRARLEGIANGNQIVTDKLPTNFMHLGLISRLFPEARIIHCKRDPLDTCLSCYFRNFGDRHNYTTDLESLGRMYRLYERLMRHWREVVGLPMLEVQYEDLVLRQEETTRAILDYCGLGWDEQCLRFYDNTRMIHTASYNQVRQPIYSRSCGRWKHYQAHLGPLVRALQGSAAEAGKEPVS